MVTRPTARARRIATQSFAKLVVVALFFVAVGAAQAIEISIGPQELIYTKSKRISTWPDGNLGPVALGNGLYEFYGANGSKPIRTIGTLTDPGSNKKSVKIEGVPKKQFDYLAGGPVYVDPTTGTKIMVYHAEVNGKKKTDFHAYLGLAVATDATGLRFRDLGTIIDANTRGPAEIGGGTFAVFDGYFNVYYKDWLADGSTAELAVARASVSDVINNALAGQGTTFNKYYNGGWTEPGLGGKSSYLETSNAANSWTAVSWNDYLNQLVMVSANGCPMAAICTWHFRQTASIFHRDRRLQLARANNSIRPSSAPAPIRLIAINRSTSITPTVKKAAGAAGKTRSLFARRSRLIRALRRQC